MRRKYGLGKALTAIAVALTGIGAAAVGGGTGIAAGSQAAAAAGTTCTSGTSASTSSSTSTSSTTSTSTSSTTGTCSSSTTSSTGTSTSTSSSSSSSTSTTETSTSTSTTETSTSTSTTETTSTPPLPSGPVAVYPIAGSQVASPQAEIAFRGIDPSVLSSISISVSGSSSGDHSGRIAADSDQSGGSFIPDRPFSPGETVTVSTPLHLVGAAGGSYRFRVASPAAKLFHQSPLLVRWHRGYTMGFRTRRDLKPAAVRILHSAGAGDEPIFLTPQFGPLQNGPMILDARGQLVWFMPVPYGNIAADLRVQRYQGKPVLTWWQGYTGSGAGSGVDEIYDSSYRPVLTLKAGNGLAADLHEFDLTPTGSALITCFYPVVWNGTSVGGGKNQVVFDGVVQELDVSTGRVLFQWDSLDHVPIRDSYSRVSKRHHYPYDYFHINSVAEDADGNLIVSARNTWAAYKVRRSDGAVLWTLGGKHSSFRFGRGAGFAFQHDVRIRARDDHLLSLFDDGAGPPAVHSQSRALELSLNMKRRIANVAEIDVHAPALSANFEGNVQQLSNFDDFIGWGQQPYFSQYDRRGHLVLDGRFVSGTSSYRAYRFAWAGTPTGAPAVSAQRSRGTTSVYVSWNGATSVAAWRVFAGASAGAIRVIRTVSKHGFETATTIHAGPYVRVQALGTHQNVLATSGTVKAG